MHSALPTKSCHNCRRKRRKCDLSVPSCHRCTSTGQECLGYGKLILWNKGVASRGKMTGKSFERPENVTQNQVRFPSAVPLQHPRSIPSDLQISVPLEKPLLDPLFQDLNPRIRFYLRYFQSQVCKDLVAYDLPTYNPFRDLLPFTKNYAVLLHIIVAIAARHLSNVEQGLLLNSSHKTTLIKRSGDNGPFITHGISNPHRDALLANQYALRLLGPALEATDIVGLDVALASILLFIEFELVDSGRDNWKIHVDGSRQLIDCISKLKDSDVSVWRQRVISCCLIYDIVGATLRTSNISTVLQNSSIDISSVLAQGEANNYLSCPAALLEILLHLPRFSQKNAQAEDLTIMINEGHRFLQIAENFDPVKWAVDLQRTSPTSDLEKRIHIASAHKAAVRLYICRVVYPPFQDESIYEIIVTEIILHLSQIPSDHALFKSTTWPTFLAGVETEDPIQRRWALKRLQDIVVSLPWGSIQSVINILEVIWEAKSKSEQKLNWLEELEKLKIDWFVG